MCRDRRAGRQGGGSDSERGIPQRPFLCSSPTGHPFSMLAKCHLSRECKKVIKKAEVSQKVTSKWLEACDRQYCVMEMSRMMYFNVCKIMLVCTEGLFLI